MCMICGKISTLLTTHIAQALAVFTAQGTLIDKSDNRVAQQWLQIDRVVGADEEEIIGFKILLPR